MIIQEVKDIMDLPYPGIFVVRRLTETGLIAPSGIARFDETVGHYGAKSHMLYCIVATESIFPQYNDYQMFCISAHLCICMVKLEVGETAAISGIVTAAGPAGHMPYQLEFCALPTCLITTQMWGVNYFLNCTQNGAMIRHYSFPPLPNVIMPVGR